jgi:hypothetical protein
VRESFPGPDEQAGQGDGAALDPERRLISGLHRLEAFGRCNGAHAAQSQSCETRHHAMVILGTGATPYPVRIGGRPSVS